MADNEILIPIRRQHSATRAALEALVTKKQRWGYAENEDLLLVRRSDLSRRYFSRSALCIPGTEYDVGVELTAAGNVNILTDDAVLSLGADSEVTLTHIHNTGIRLNAAMQLQFRDSALAISSKNDGFMDFDADTGFRFNTDRLTVGSLGVGTASGCGYYINSVLQLASPVAFTNIAVGASVMVNVGLTGGNNTGVGYASLNELSTGVANAAVGDHALNELTSGDYNVAVGYKAGTTEDASNNRSGTLGVYIGKCAYASADALTNEIVIGSTTTGHGSNTVTVGNSSITNNYFTGNFNLVGGELVIGDIAGEHIITDIVFGNLYFNNGVTRKITLDATNSKIWYSNDTRFESMLLEMYNAGNSTFKHDSATGITRLGSASNYANFAGNGDQTFVGTAGFYPRALNQTAEPAAGTGTTELDTGEMCVWTDTDDAKCYLCYNHGGTVKTVEMT